MDEARAIVDDAVQRGFGGDGWIWISNLFAEGYPAKFFISGWDSALDWVIWSRDDKCLLMLPFDEEPPSGGHAWNCSFTSPFLRPAHQTRPRSEFASTTDLSRISTCRLTTGL